MKTRFFYRLLLLLLFAAPFGLSAQETPEKGAFTIGVNPAYFVLGGYYLNPQYHFPKRWSVGTTLQGGFTLPDFARDQFFDVSSDASEIDWTYAIGIDVAYRFTEANYNKGFYLTAALGYEAWEIANGMNTATLDNWFTSFGAGYNWYPTKNQRLYLGLQYNIIFLLNNTDERAVGDGTFELESVVPPGLLPSVLTVGWRF